MFEYSVHNRVVPRRASVGTLNLYVVMVRVRVERNPEGQTPSNIVVLPMNLFNHTTCSLCRVFSCALAGGENPESYPSVSAPAIGHEAPHTF